jgi:hypothetical protein
MLPGGSQSKDRRPNESPNECLTTSQPPCSRFRPFELSRSSPPNPFKYITPTQAAQKLQTPSPAFHPCKSVFHPWLLPRDFPAFSCFSWPFLSLAALHRSVFQGQLSASPPRTIMVPLHARPSAGQPTFHAPFRPPTARASHHRAASGRGGTLPGRAGDADRSPALCAGRLFALAAAAGKPQAARR